MVRRAGSADLPLHGGRVPKWLGDRMTRLGAVITEAIVLEYGRDELLRRLAHPFWFQSFGAVMGMDWHSSGVATSVIGALKREGLSVPRDVSVAGFDGIAIGRLIDPPLTTIEMPDASMGATAASLLLDMAENAAPARHLDVAYALRRGGTVRDITPALE